MAINKDVEVILQGTSGEAGSVAKNVYANREAIIKIADEVDTLAGTVGAIEDHISNSIQFLSALPTAAVTYNDYSTTRFVAKERCSVSLVTDTEEDEHAPYEKISTSSSSTQNKYGYATLDLSSITARADTVIVDITAKIPNTRCYFGLGNMENRPGESYRGTYTYEDIAFYFGTKDGSNFYANGKAFSVAKSVINAWATVSLVIDLKSKTVSYKITKDGSVLYSGSTEFADSNVENITGIEMYSWVNSTDIMIGDISVTASYGAKENVLYAIANESGNYNLYAYKDGLPIKFT